MTLRLVALLSVVPVGYYLWRLLSFRGGYAAFLPVGAVLALLSGGLLYAQSQEAVMVTVALYIALLASSAVMYLDKKFAILRCAMFLSTFLSFATVICIAACLAFKSKLFFAEVPLADFLLGTTWNPDSQVINGKPAGSFGILPLLSGTLLIVIVAITVALPLGLLSAIYVSEYSDKRVRRTFNTLLEVLCGIPTVVYGYFAVVFLSPNIRSFAEFCGFNAQSENSLTAGLTIGIMILPFVTLLTENALRSVPKILRYGSMALGATRAETTWNIVIPYALPDICSSVILAISRVIGETMIVLMAAGVTANFTFNPLHSVTTITVQIATILTGDQNFQSVHTSSAYALALTLFVITWALNLVAAYITRRTDAPSKSA
ncbi:phosphate ABC transporter permease [Anaplasma marginale str. Dawn]|uniref:Phosphate transport system permease protein n=3 Tax=Anaplasma TaxID=768 RepID=B9KHT4_ANAMF|nr:MULTISPECIES: phosphate ABC transporter permease subunit PstC [Anaplasma]AAV86338.1 ABC-type phosphate transport system, permease component [Anaplasma marginale str. St. Maries]ACM49046.1 ABC-type phosphate transport system, permease component (pstC) [Anaplasma marginale str. Florida]ACZ49542.1 phosphate ABC transporter, permease protein [Anaplasma centrale str. Israel]AGZ78615.1 phosphate ABC transporter permease [Anaplasma marginale str. Gypsy Plains]AGZ79466.1 phosphate ABC transporter p